ncbi:right-handed parallel beta-helix repeat-containing protein [Asticcacaulis benevestitus]|uniref:Transcriptional initiation protein Tat n=1 Tax=Asticcacaulis benevestitus DSM 16100 = ATCC BAA-896 TaxID=1121022 RepID=V4NPC0_9CAUL|nr:right-handed parallel beta-helix repeat-containing protein [Asticcacaulis benevestitus]ESQ83627.1 transcriptional initiation protein Tat [Asticcacaulis benevestitus DSM 16100 = ATCC BAA-896]
MGYAAVGATAALSGGAWGCPTAVPDTRLPDGTNFALWEQPLSFSKTYYVDNTLAVADDDGPGDQARPFRTVNRAAQVLQPGERVVIAAGTYRECVRPARGGDAPSRMISYEAAPGAKVYIKGSEILTDGWHQETVSVAFRPPGSLASPEDGVTTWRHNLDGALFPDAYNPFALPSLMGQWAWLNPAKVDMGPYLRRRGLVFVDGKPLEPVEQLRELAAPALRPFPDFTVEPVPQNGLPARRRGGPIMQEIGGVPDSRIWVDPSGTAIQIRLASGTPADHVIEVTTRQHVFIPAKSGLSFIRVKGLTFQHAGNAYPFPQYGMVSLAGGDHWILEDNTLEWANGLGLAIGFDGDSAGALNAGTSQVVRRNSIRYCGVGGIGGMGTLDTLIEDNLIEWCGWADAERGWEAAGAKFHRARNMMFRRNVVRHMRHANAAWWDSEDSNCRITGNIFADVLTVSAAVHLEMNREPNQIDNNIIWDVRNAEPGTPGQRGCAGSGLFINATDQLIVAQNLIGRCDNSGVFAILRPDRAGSGQGRDNTIANNIFARCGSSAIVFLDPKNTADGNVFVDMPARFLGYYQGDAKTYLDLAAWRTAYGWDRTSIEAEMRVEFDPATLRLTLSRVRTLPKMATSNHIQSDLLGVQTGATRVAGPLANPSSRESWMVDPRRRACI